jgi:hypothetical protein
LFHSIDQNKYQCHLIEKPSLVMRQKGVLATLLMTIFQIVYENDCSFKE